MKSSTYSKFSSSGPRITRENGEFVGYALEIEQEIFDERDANFGCKNYPTESYSTYQDCDQNLTRKWIASLVSDFIPVWASNSLNDITASRYVSNKTNERQWVDWSPLMFEGVYRTQCPLPCKTTKISVR